MGLGLRSQGRELCVQFAQSVNSQVCGRSVATTHRHAKATKKWSGATSGRTVQLGVFMDKLEAGETVSVYVSAWCWFRG